MKIFNMARIEGFSIHLNLCGDSNHNLMTEILEEIRKTSYNRFSIHVVSKY